MTSSGNSGESPKKKGYEPAYFAQKHRISLPIARALIEQFGDDREALNQAAQYIRKV
jgi:predicted N-acyltransferase